LSNWFLFLSSFVFPLLFRHCFIPVSLSHVVSSLAYPNLLGTKSLGCWVELLKKSSITLEEYGGSESRVPDSQFSRRLLSLRWVMLGFFSKASDVLLIRQSPLTDV
jgi:hypothetical protein